MMNPALKNCLNFMWPLQNKIQISDPLFRHFQHLSTMQQQRQQQRPQATTLSTVLQLRSSDLTTTEGAWRPPEVTRRRPDSIKSRMLSWLFLSTRDDAMNHQVRVNLNYRTFILINRQYSPNSHTERIWILNGQWRSVFNGIQFLNSFEQNGRHFVRIPNGTDHLKTKLG